MSEKENYKLKKKYKISEGLIYNLMFTYLLRIIWFL